MGIDVMATLMNFFSVTAPTPAVTEAGAKTDRLGRVIAWFKAGHERRVAVWELRRLDEHSLRDLRITKSDFQDIADGTFQR